MMKLLTGIWFIYDSPAATMTTHPPSFLNTGLEEEGVNTLREMDVDM